MNLGLTDLDECYDNGTQWVTLLLCYLFDSSGLSIFQKKSKTLMIIKTHK